MVMCMTVACFFGCCLWDYYDVYGVIFGVWSREVLIAVELEEF